MTLAFAPDALHMVRVGPRYTTINEFHLFAILTVGEMLRILHRCREDRLVAWNTRGMRTMGHGGSERREVLSIGEVCDNKP